VAIRDGARGNQIGPNNTIAYSSEIDIEIVDGKDNIIGPDNRILQNFLPTIRVLRDSSGNVITRNSLRTTGKVRGHEAMTERACHLLGTCSYAGAIEIERGSQGGISPPRITHVNTMQGRVAGTTCPECIIEVFAGGLMSPYTFEGSAQAGADGQFSFDKGAPLGERGLLLTATDPERGTSAVDSPLCRDVVFPRSSAEGEISVMTWNILAKPFGVYRDGAWHVEDMFDWRNLSPEEWEAVSPEWSDFIELIEYANADILALQEVQEWIREDHRMLRAVAERLGYPYFTLGVVHDEDGGPSAGILSRFQILSFEQNDIGNGNMRAEIRLPDGETLQVIDVHIRNCTGPEGDQLPRLLEWIAPYREVPTIVLGDFNANLTDPRIATCFASMTERGWHLVADNWSQRLPADSIWVSTQLFAFARSASAVTWCASKAGYEISDHTPVMILLRTPWEETVE
jgi:endonuclease/exonuclease/phosphatase family metal-dependent hydrolase